MTLLAPGTDRYGAIVIPDAEGDWTFRVEGWSDVYGTWEHDATVKIAAGVDVDLMLEEGARVLERALAGDDRTAVTRRRRRRLPAATRVDARLRDARPPAPQARLAAGDRARGARRPRPAIRCATW